LAIRNLCALSGSGVRAWGRIRVMNQRERRRVDKKKREMRAKT